MNIPYENQADTLYFDTVDSFLGESKTRYFSSGYKLIKYQFEDVLLHNDELIGILHVEWPKIWAQKKHESIAPHLGSLELFVIAAHLVELYLKGIDNLTDSEIENAWVSFIKINSGVQAISEIKAEECGCKKISECIIDDKTIQSSFSVKIVSTLVQITICHRKNSVPAYMSVNALQLLVKNFYSSFFSIGYKVPVCSIKNVYVNTTERKAQAEIDICNHELLSEFTGIGRAFQPFFNFTDGILVVGQVTQTLLYNLDGLTRDNTSNLWMRCIESTYKSPIPFDEIITLDIHAEEFKTLRIKDAVYRVSTIHISISNSRITGKIKVAHQI
ncbi:MAG: AvrD family protein [Bacteroidota bacterium]